MDDLSGDLAAMKNISFNLSILKRPGPKKPLIIRDFLVLFFVLIVIFINFKQVSRQQITDLKEIFINLIEHPDFSYEDKMEIKAGRDYYEWTKLVRAHTDQNSLVFHPPQMWPWGQSGNPEYSQYFLFPAKLIREDRERLVTKKDINFVAIALGEGGEFEERLLGWPKFPVFAQKIYYLPQNRKAEIKGLDGLTREYHKADRVINSQNGNSWDITYTSSFYDYWMKSVELALMPETEYKLEVKSNWLNSTSLVARVRFSNGKEAIFSSSPNKETDTWTTLSLDNLYSRAVSFAGLSGWPTDGLKISDIGIDTGHPAIMPYQEKWGLIEVETGTKDRLEALGKEVLNDQSLLSLGNIYQLNGDTEQALKSYQQAVVLEPSNPWSHLGAADSAKKIGDRSLAYAQYQEAISADPEDAWFYYALGKYYQDINELDKASELYDESLNRYPDAVWAHLGLGEVYEDEGRLDLAAGQYRLASVSPRRDFTSDGKVAWQKLMEIEDGQRKVVADSLMKLSQNPDNQPVRDVLSRAYLILGETAKAEEQYRLAYPASQTDGKGNIALPPKWTDPLSQPVYGKRGPAVDSRLVDNRHISLLDNYHSYISFSRLLFPANNGTIEIRWRLPKSHNSSSSQASLNLIYQFKSLIFWFSENRFQLGLFDQQKKTWQIVQSSPLSLDENKWYRVGISYGGKGERIFLDGEKIAESGFNGGLNTSSDFYLGRGILWSVSDSLVQSGYFDTISVYDYQKL